MPGVYDILPSELRVFPTRMEAHQWLHDLGRDFPYDNSTFAPTFKSSHDDQHLEGQHPPKSKKRGPKDKTKQVKHRQQRHDDGKIKACVPCHTRKKRCDLLPGFNQTCL
jgi:hypothetical protein